MKMHFHVHILYYYCILFRSKCLLFYFRRHFLLHCISHHKTSTMKTSHTKHRYFSADSSRLTENKQQFNECLYTHTCQSSSARRLVT